MLFAQLVTVAVYQQAALQKARFSVKARVLDDDADLQGKVGDALHLQPPGLGLILLLPGLQLRCTCIASCFARCRWLHDRRLALSNDGEYSEE